MMPTLIQAKPDSPEREAAFAAMVQFLEAHEISPSVFFNAIIPRIVFCCHNYTRADEDGNPIVEMNLGPVLLRNKENERRRKALERQGKPNFDAAL
jgi:hypothetical protein